ncbi:BlaI/MecI/CopY family transcriptional regulator [Anaerocolumna sp. MB42-C2]|uniref:BlaI/MecI/CopY family transcriptional regulator n=1 Tax=Anaerocolumna sp. MB42-C2 TaxID=3070997 RepID=UPI0027E04897|nr:BlaI/MecI/CopY family transcriptional regulator [Anaerocolumna sp. MB42-C2]WMJ85537.1 BlaI/MecI/CopY family transcriptional regulator [Anaerocolumna sp. MB42-C2]
METAAKISDSEWEVMKIIWKNPNCTALDIIEQLKDSQKWKPKTVKTLIRRLIDKNIIGFEQYGREYKYYSLVNEDECRKAESDSFLQRVYSGSLKSMLLNLIEKENLSKEDLEDLKSILNERKM